MDYGLAFADYAVIAGFFVVLMAVGLFYAGRMQDLRDFFSGGRQVPWWLSGISLYMTTFSAFTFVAYSAIAYKDGFVAVTVWWFSVPGCLLSAWFLASRWRRATNTSPVEYLEKRFGPQLRQCFSWFGIPLIVLDDALKLFVIGKMISVSLGLEGTVGTTWAIVICGLIMVSYTLLGGLWAVLITDFVQFVVMGIAVLVLAPLALSKAGGLAAIAEKVPAEMRGITSETYSWPWLLAFSVILALTFATKWPYVQRYYAARDDRDARRVGYLVAALTIVLPPLLFFPAFAARVFLPDIADTNTVYPMLCRELLPVGMMGILLAAMFAATMSMLSSDYNSAASVITNDILKRLVMPNASDKALVVVARLATLVVGLVAMVLAVLLAQAEGLEDLVKYMARLFAAMLPPIALPMIAGLVSRRASNGGALLGFFLGAVCAIGAYIVGGQEDYGYLRTVQYLTWLSLVPTAIGLALGSLVFPNSGEKKRVVAEFIDGLTSDATQVDAKPDSAGAVMALRVIGATITLLGIILVAAVVLTVPIRDAGLSICVGLVMALGGAAAVGGSYWRKDAA
jgi:SSS family transporter